MTVYIPTYNRPAQLASTLQKLLPQLTHQVELVISDNCSEPPVAQTLGAEMLSRVRIIRNRYNVGANENILRGFEAARTAWLWTLSDDDQVSDTAVSDILRTIALHAGDPSVAILKFGLEEQPIPAFTMTSIDQVPDCMGNLIFISSSVYQVETCRDAATVAHQYTYSMAPALMTLLVAVLNNKKVVFCQSVIVNWVRARNVHEWSFLGFSNSLLTLFEYPFPSHLRRDLYRKIMVLTYSLKRLMYIDLQHSCVDSQEARDVRFLVRCIYAKRSVLGTWRERWWIHLIRTVTSISFVNAIMYRALRAITRDQHQVQYDRTTRG